MAEILYRLRDVWRFAGGRPILAGIEGEIPAGEILTVIGPSGSGKSTFISLLNRLIDADRGEIEFKGKEIRTWEVTELRRRVGLVFQSPTMLPGTVRENLEFGPRLRGEVLGEGAAELIRRVGLPEAFLDRPAAELSGGEKARVALARTLANRPDVLLLDEITASLDPEAAAGVEALVTGLHSESGQSCVWVTHDLRQARRVGTITWFFEGGRVLERGPTAEIFERPSERLRQFAASGAGVET